MKIVFASNNANKIREIKLLLPDSIQMLSLEDIGCHEEIPEPADTIEGNAIEKANYITQKYGYDCFADDSGLEVDVLNGEPGVYSARYAGDHKNNDDNINKLLEKLAQTENRAANFKTVIALNLGGEQHLFTGKVNGTITKKRLGSEGFGYDSVFIPDGSTLTFAQISATEKAKDSHRSRAVKQLVAHLRK
ncbi:MAG: non-canonical purine NTP diphosphatase [Flavobacterium sp.]|nr:non-canonical purine NTP diphosphatase [Flavobacterium sp.]